MKTNKLAMAVVVLSTLLLNSVSAADALLAAEKAKGMHARIATAQLIDARKIGSLALHAVDTVVAAPIHAVPAYVAFLAASETEELLGVAEGSVTLDTYIGHSIGRIKNKVKTWLRIVTAAGPNDAAVVTTNANGGGAVFGADNVTGTRLDDGHGGGALMTAAMMPADGTVAALEASIFAVLDSINTKAKINTYYNNLGTSLQVVRPASEETVDLEGLRAALRTCVGDALTLWHQTLWATAPGNNILAAPAALVPNTPIPATALGGKTSALVAADAHIQLADQHGDTLGDAIAYVASH